jgi:bifunctional non-homologous end joining protein LigD
MVIRIATTSTPLLPMLATAGPVPPAPGWAFEFAWDGARVLADVSADRVRLIGGDQGFAARCPELDGLRGLAGRHRVVLDGSVVVLDSLGRPSGAALRRRMAAQRPSQATLSRYPVAYYVFDVLELDGRVTVDLPYTTRRALLEKLDLPGTAVRLAPAFGLPDGPAEPLPDDLAHLDGAVVLETAGRFGLHGVVAKRLDSRYEPGRRSRAWVETAVLRTTDVVVGGWLQDRSGGVRGLVVGVPVDGGGLRHVGTVRTGIAAGPSAATLAELERPTSPFVGPGAPRARWVSPELWGTVSHRGRTSAGRLDRPVWTATHPAPRPVPPIPLSAGSANRPGTNLPGTSHPVGGVAVGRGLEEELRAARAEVDALRAQISPHFLYNVLNMIGSYIRTDAPFARDLLGEFADFTRYAFRPGVGLSTLGAELDNVERYLGLQRARFGDRLRVRLSVPPAALGAPVPHLALQLAVEHAVQHSIEPKPGGGTVTVTVVPNGEPGTGWQVSVTDDGIGPGALSALDQRLRAVSAALTVRPHPGGGATLTFPIPAG